MRNCSSVSPKRSAWPSSSIASSIFWPLTNVPLRLQSRTDQPPEAGDSTAWTREHSGSLNTI